MIESMMNHWFAVQVRPQSERMVSLILRQKGYEEFIPSSPTTTVERRQLLRPLFPGYVFCKVTTSARGPIVTTPGVVRILGAGATPTPVPEYEIDSLRRLVSSGLPVEAWPRLEPGESVELVGGPLHGCRGIVKTWKSERRLIVSITILQRAVSVEITPESVHRAPAGRETAVSPATVRSIAV